MNGYINSISYPIFRESTSKIYVPRYYGIEKYGECDKNRLVKGNDIDLTFCGKLFDYQINIINKYF